MDDIYEPLERYKNELKAAFRKNAEEAFAEIEAKATINKQENLSYPACLGNTMFLKFMG